MSAYKNVTIYFKIMNIIDIILITLSLSIDNFAVSAASSCGGKGCSSVHIFKVAGSFCAMGLLFLFCGYFGGVKLLGYISSWDHIFGPLILFYIGGKMIKGALAERGGAADSCQRFDMRGLKVLFALALATNIDVLAAGVSMAAFEVDIAAAALFLALFVCLAVILGFTIGSRLGRRFGGRVEAIGGLVLIGLSVKIFLEG